MKRITERLVKIWKTVSPLAMNSLTNIKPIPVTLPVLISFGGHYFTPDTSVKSV